MSALEPAVLTGEILERLEKRADPDREEMAKDYYPTSMRVIGVKVPDIRAIVLEVSKRLNSEAPPVVMSVARALVATGVHECAKVAFELLGRHRPTLRAIKTSDLKSIGKGLDNWVSVDNFAGLVAGPAWREGNIPDSFIHTWARSSDRWLRRAAVVATVALNQRARGGTGDPPRTLEVCAMVADDQDDMVAKALSWALRELAKVDPAPVREFLADHDAVLPARVKREVTRKLETGRK